MTISAGSGLMPVRAWMVISVGDYDQARARAMLAHQGSHLANLVGALAGATEEVAEGRPGLGGIEGQARGLEAATPGTRQHPIDGDASSAERLAEPAGVAATLIGQVALRAAVVQPHARGIADARGGDCVADQDDLPASPEQVPERLARGGGLRKGQQQRERPAEQCPQNVPRPAMPVARSMSWTRRRPTRFLSVSVVPPPRLP